MNKKQALNFIRYLLEEEGAGDTSSKTILSLIEKDSKEFVNFCINWFGGRRLNRYLCYDILAISLVRFMKNCKGIHNTLPLMNAVEGLLYDDRHDLYQNLPYYIREFLKENPESSEILYSHLEKALLNAIDRFGQRGGDLKLTHLIFREED